MFYCLLSFDVSLTCGRDLEKDDLPFDVALKLTASFGNRQFLRRARVSGKWTDEEASTAYFPFIPDQPFRVRASLLLVSQHKKRWSLRSARSFPNLEVRGSNTRTKDQDRI